MNYAVIKTIIKIIEMRDPNIADHQKRVALIARHITETMNVSEDRIITTYISGLIHDLGMMAIPASIVCKAGRLNDLEMELVKMHPQSAFEILKDLDFGFPVSRVILEHHERIDGSGYPQGLVSEEILLESKILAVADTIEAMTSHRPYRPALSMDTVFEEINSNREILYDPAVVDASIEILTQNNPDLAQLYQGSGTRLNLDMIHMNLK